MSIEARPQRSIIAAILLVTSIMLAISVTGFNRINLLASDLEHIIQQQENQSALMYAIRQAAQERSLVLQTMIISRDPFVIDELSIAMSQLASDYIDSRSKLLALELSREERVLLERQHLQTSNTATLQIQVVDLTREERHEEAARLLLDEALPSQHKAMAMMDQFIQMKRTQNLSMLSDTSQLIERTYLLMTLLGLLSIVMGAAIALRVSRRIATEMEQRRQSEVELRKRELYERTIRENIIDGLLTLTADGHILSCNRACSDIFGYSTKEMTGSLATMLIPAQLENNHHDLSKHLADWDRYTGKDRRFTGRRRDGSHFPAELDISRITLGDEDIYIAVVRDISEKVRAQQRIAQFQQELEQRVQERTDELVRANGLLRHEIEERVNIQQELTHLANHDPLTQLPNRARFAEQLSISLHQAKRHQRLLALLFLDLDGFKALNDLHGHGTGDEALIEVANRLCATVRREDMVARMGGDEFTVLLGEINKPEDASQVAQKLITEINRPFTIGEHTCHLGTSIGISVFPHNTDNPDTLLRLADDAMYAAKESGKNTWCISATCALPPSPSGQG